MTDRQLGELVERTSEKVRGAIQNLSKDDYKVLQDVHDKFAGKSIPPCMPSTAELLKQLEERLPGAEKSAKPVNSEPRPAGMKLDNPDKSIPTEATPRRTDSPSGGRDRAKPGNAEKPKDPAGESIYLTEGTVQKVFDNTNPINNRNEVDCMPFKQELEKEFRNRLKSGKYSEEHTPSGLKPAKALDIPNKM